MTSTGCSTNQGECQWGMGPKNAILPFYVHFPMMYMYIYYVTVIYCSLIERQLLNQESVHLQFLLSSDICYSLHIQRNLGCRTVQFLNKLVVNTFLERKKKKIQFLKEISVYKQNKL